MGKWKRQGIITSDIIDGVRIVRKEYSQWQSMIQRTKGAKYYDSVTCSESFKDYGLYLSWAKNQRGFLNNNKDGSIWALDKDIVGDGTLYSEDTCVFVPQEINNLAKSNGDKDLPLGVTRVDKKKDGGNTLVSLGTYLGMTFTLGYYDDPLRAFEVYLKFRKLMIEDIAIRYGDTIDDRVIPKLLETCCIDNYVLPDVSVDIL